MHRIVSDCRGRLGEGHSIIVPTEHVASTRQVDDHIWTELRNFKKCLLQMHMAQVTHLLVIKLYLVCPVLGLGVQGPGLEGQDAFLATLNTCFLCVIMWRCQGVCTVLLKYCNLLESLQCFRCLAGDRLVVAFGM